VLQHPKWHGFASDCASGNDDRTSDNGRRFVCGDDAKEEQPVSNFHSFSSELEVLLGEKKKSRAKLFSPPFFLVLVRVFPTAATSKNHILVSEMTSRAPSIQ